MFFTIIIFVEMIQSVSAFMTMTICAFVNLIVLVLIVSCITLKLIDVVNVFTMEYVSKMRPIFCVSVHNVIKVSCVNWIYKHLVSLSIPFLLRIPEKWKSFICHWCFYSFCLVSSTIFVLFSLSNDLLLENLELVIICC